MAKQSNNLIATIDTSLITIEVDNEEFGFDTASQIAVEPEIEEQDAVRLIIKGVLRAQKLGESILTGNTITLTDNVFNPELVLVLQGGTITYDGGDSTKIAGYTPPASNAENKGETFKLNAYTAQYNAAGQIVQYEKITYPNCLGRPVAFGSTDGEFRVSEYTIVSAADIDEAPYEIEYVDELPVLTTT